MSLRVINLGLPKTGTTTLGRALKASGLRTADHRIRRHQSDDPDVRNAFVAELLYKGYFETGDPAAHLVGFDAISEMSCLRDGRSLWPQMDAGMIDALRQHHPKARFVATHRPTWDVSQSMLAWSDLGSDRLPSGDVPGLPKGYGETSKERERWIDAHYAHLALLFAGDEAYLELDITAPDAKDQLSAHLNLEITWWGRANSKHDRTQVA